MSIGRIGANLNKGFENLGKRLSSSKIAGKRPDLLNRIAKLNEPVKNAVNPTMFAVALYTCVLVPRAAMAGKRSKTEKREVITRDTIGLTTLVFAMKAINGTIAKAAQKATGLILTSETTPLKGLNPFRKFIEYIRPTKGVGVLSTEELASKLAISDKKGLKGLVGWLGDNGGDAAKALSVDAKKGGVLSGLANQLFEDGIKGKTTQEILGAIDKSENGTVVDEIVKMLRSDTNPLVKKAKSINSGLIKTLGLAVVVAVLGIGLPKFNEYLTKKLDGKEAQGKTKTGEEQGDSVSIGQATQEETTTFKDFLGK